TTQDRRSPSRWRPPGQSCRATSTSVTRRCASSCRWRSAPAANTASTSASAARVRRITPTSRAGCSIRASRACRSTPIRWWRPGCSSRSALKAAWPPEVLRHAGVCRREQPRAVVAQLTDRFVDVRVREVSPLLDETLGHRRRPAARQLFQRADVEIAVMKEALELGHAAREKATVLADAVAAHRRAAAVDQRREELQRALLRFSDAAAAGAHPRQQAGGAVLALIPVVHARE